MDFEFQAKGRLIREANAMTFPKTPIGFENERNRRKAVLEQWMKPEDVARIKQQETNQTMNNKVTFRRPYSEKVEQSFTGVLEIRDAGELRTELKQIEATLEKSNLDWSKINRQNEDSLAVTVDIIKRHIRNGLIKLKDENLPTDKIFERKV